MLHLPNKNEFVRRLGQAYINCDCFDGDTYIDVCQDYGSDDGIDADIPEYDEDIDIYARLVDLFDDDELWISEWLSCQRQGRAFTYYEPSDTANEKYTITSAGEFYDFLVKVQEEKKNDAVKERFI